MPGYVNGIPHATSTDRIDLWPTTSHNLAEWIDGNMVRDDDPRLTNARPPTSHTHPQSEVAGLVAALDGKQSIEPVELGDNADANTLTVPGQYVETSATQAGTSTNFPEQRAGVLDVTATGTRLHVWQLWRPYAGHRLYMRSRTGGTWSAWEQIATGPQLTALADRLPALEYDSGERDITSLLPGVVSGALHVQRVGRTVWIDFRDLVITDQGTTWITFSGLLPQGFRPSRSFKYFPLAANQHTSYALGPARLSAQGDLLIYDASDQRTMRGLVSFPTPDAPPSSPPGDPA